MIPSTTSKDLSNASAGTYSIGKVRQWMRYALSYLVLGLVGSGLFLQLKFLPTVYAPPRATSSLTSPTINTTVTQWDLIEATKEGNAFQDWLRNRLVTKDAFNSYTFEDISHKRHEFEQWQRQQQVSNKTTATSKEGSPSTNSSAAAATSNSRSANLKGNAAKKMVKSQKKKSVKRKSGKNNTAKSSPQNKNSKADASFGACLLIKDDNHWLIEWLAYHYHVLPLRHLMIAVDPTSQTSPLDILNRWKPFMDSLVVWTDTDFMPSNAAKSKELQQVYKNNTQLRDHRVRQTTFYTKCLQHFKGTGKVNWVQLTDTDEFTSLNYQDSSNEVQQLMLQHPIEEPGSVLHFLEQHWHATDKAEKCIYVNRYNVGSTESALVAELAPNLNLTAQDFLTQQFFVRSPKPVQYGKNVVHLGNMNLLKPNPNVHRVSMHCPSKERSLNVESTTFLKASHYIGTPTQFFARRDPRAQEDIGSKANKNARDMNLYQALNRTASKTDRSAQKWLSGFVESVGLEQAGSLLQGVGQVGVE